MSGLGASATYPRAMGRKSLHQCERSDLLTKYLGKALRKLGWFAVTRVKHAKAVLNTRLKAPDLKSSALAFSPCHRINQSNANPGSSQVARCREKLRLDHDIPMD